MMKLPPYAVAVAAAFFAFTASAAAPAWQMIKEKSNLKFYAIQNGAPVEGKFKDFTTDIHFDPEHLDESAITVEVDTGSVEVASADVMQTIKTADWLSSEAFPKAVFKSKKITRMPMSDNYYGDGELTLRGKTLPVTLNFQMEYMQGNNAIAKGYVTLRRTDYGVGQGEWAKDDVIKNEVRVEFRIAAEKK